MKYRVVVFSLALAAAFSFATQAQAQVRALVTQPINDLDTVELPGNVRPEANANNDRGPVADTLVLEHMQLLLQRPPETEAALESAIERLYDKNSPDFHRWLDSKTLRDEYGPAQSDIDTVTTWLGTHGMIVHGVLTSGMIIDFSGDAAAVRETFHTEIHNLDVQGESRIANMSNPRIPANLAKLVNGVVSLNSFPARHMLTTGKGAGGLGLPGYLLAPGDLWTIYNVNPLLKAGITGKGQTVVLVEDSNLYNTADWTTFRSKLGLSGYTSASFKQTHPISSVANCTSPGVNGDSGEATLDVEWASAAAPNAAIVLASCAQTNVAFGFFLAAENLIDSTSPPAILSMSYGECEAFLGASANGAFNTVFQKGAAVGTSIYVSAGDQLSAGCPGDVSTAVSDGIGVNGMASTPYAVAAGGTDFADAAENHQSEYWRASNSSTYESAIKYPAEIPWNNTCASPAVGVVLELGLVTIPPVPAAYGKDGVCNVLGILGDDYSLDLSFLLSNSGGSGGPSACATGAPSVAGVVGGTCKGHPKPTWQESLFGNPSDGVRDLPDVSLFASSGNVWGHGYVYCYSNPSGGHTCTSKNAPYDWSVAGGTSFVAPILAGVQALINQKKGAKQGNPNPVFYALAKSEYGASGNSACNSSNARPTGTGVKASCIFNDVTGEFGISGTGTELYDLGSTAAPCMATKSSKLYDCYRPSGTYGVLSTSNTSFKPAYPTTAGWDFATGIGSINITNLVNGW